MCTTNPLDPEVSRNEVGKFKYWFISVELLQTGSRTLHSEVHKLTVSVTNGKD